MVTPMGDKEKVSDLIMEVQENMVAITTGIKDEDLVRSYARRFSVV